MNIKVILSLVLCLSLLTLMFFIPQNSESKSFDSEFLRIHIRANSNEEIDQNVKYHVRDAVVDYLTPLLCDADTKVAAMRILKNHLGDIETISNKVLLENGFSYKSSGNLTKEVFPTRTYGNTTLPAGEYDSLIINLGTGTGNNWWCVVYPPLCFVGTQGDGNVTYRSKIVDIINNFWRKTNAG